MKNLISIAVLASFPLIAMAGGGHGQDGDDSKATGHSGMSMREAHKPTAEGHNDEHSGAVGRAGDSVKVSRTIALAMNDTMRFTPSKITVTAGKTLRFLLTNDGQIPHEMVIGSTKELKEHGAMMRNMPGMAHAESNTLTLDPGQKGELVWEFGQPGQIDFACLVPGHMEAGMMGKISVE